MRAFAASGAFALSVWAFNLSGSAGDRGLSSEGARFTATAGAAFSSGPGAGSATSGSAGMDSMTTTDGYSAGAFQAAIPADPHALVPFSRPAIGGYGLDRHVPLTANPAGPGRPAAGFLMAPLALLNPSSPFGFRVSPLSGAAGDFHLGQDYAAPCGTDVYAADSGVVRAAGWHPWGGGNRVEIDHGNGLITTYNHMEAIAVRTGDGVRVGQVVGTVGSTGWSTGCHLHFETILHGRHASPSMWGLMPVHPLDSDQGGQLRSYRPGSGIPAGGSIIWALPLTHDHHNVLGDEVAAQAPATPTVPPLPPATAGPPASSGPPPSEPHPPSPPAEPAVSEPTDPVAPPTEPDTEEPPTEPSDAVAPPTEPDTEEPPTVPDDAVAPPTEPDTEEPPTEPSDVVAPPTDAEEPLIEQAEPFDPEAPPTEPTDPGEAAGSEPADPAEPSLTAAPSPTEPDGTPVPDSGDPSPTPPAGRTDPPSSPSEAEPGPSPTVPHADAEPSPPADHTPTPDSDAQASTEGELAPSPDAAAPQPTSIDPQRCPAEPQNETPAPGQYGGSLATNYAHEQLPKDAACDTPVPDPADPEQRRRH